LRQNPEPVRQDGVRAQSNPDDDPKAADADDFPAFVRSQGAHLYRTAYLLTGGDTHLAEDLVQETFGRMYAKWGRRHRIENPAGYAQTTLFNVFISMRRRKTNTERPTAVLAERSARADDADLRLTLLAALRRLPELDRAVVVLRFWEDRSVDETALALKLTQSAVRSRSFRALARVRELLGPDIFDYAESRGSRES
jgi:RNA polymerase sigma-70 factor (sigma-E family)